LEEKRLQQIEKKVPGVKMIDQEKEQKIEKKMSERFQEMIAAEKEERQEFLSRVSGETEEEEAVEEEPQNAREIFKEQIIDRSIPHRQNTGTKIWIRILIGLIIVALMVAIYLLVKGYLL